MKQVIKTIFQVIEFKRGQFGEPYTVECPGSGQDAMKMMRKTYPSSIFILEGFMIDKNYVPFEKY